jgi:hypothetical protein
MASGSEQLRRDFRPGYRCSGHDPLRGTCARTCKPMLPVNVMAPLSTMSSQPADKDRRTSQGAPRSDTCLLCLQESDRAQSSMPGYIKTFQAAWRHSQADNFVLQVG